MAERDKDSKPRPHDVLLVHGPTADGRGVRALRSRPNRLDLAELRPVKEGQPLLPGGEIVALKRREESPLLWDVDVQCQLGESTAATATASESQDRGHAGPAQVATERYRENWESIFGGPARRGLDRRTLN